MSGSPVRSSRRRSPSSPARSAVRSWRRIVSVFSCTAETNATTAEVQRADAELVVGGDGNAVQQASDLRLGKAIGPRSPLALAHPLRDLLGEAFGAHARGAER